MQSIYLNHFLNSLAFALLNSLWQMALLWVIYQFFIVIFQPTAKHKYSILIITQFAGFLWLIVTFVQSFLQTNDAMWQNVFTENKIFSANQSQKYLPLLSVFYLFFFIVQFVRLVIQFFITSQQIKQYKVYESEQWNSFTKSVAQKFSIHKKVILKTTANTVVPFTIGFLQPVIVIPVTALNNLSVQQLEAILIHELAHIKRNDYIINLLLMLSEIVMCFNPFSYLLNKEINIVREFCCDDVVLKYPYATTQYAQALLNIAKSQTQQQLTAGLAAINTKQDLLFRINRMFNVNDFSDNKTQKKQIGFAVFLGTIMFTLIGLIDSKVKDVIADSKNQLNIQNIIDQSLYKQVNCVQTNVSSKTKKTTHREQNLVKKQWANCENKIVATDKNLLWREKKIISDGFKELANAIKDKEFSLTTNTNNEIFSINDSTNINNISIVNAIKQQPKTTTEKFIIPATSQSAALAILVTTIFKDDGSKQVKIEIIKGSGQIE